jgi:hypothetical protein
VRGGIYLYYYYPLPSQNPRSLGTSPLGLTSLNRKNHPIEVTLGGIGSSYASLTSILLSFILTTNCAITNFWAFFQLNPVSDDAEDLVMKLFSATLLDASRRWYLSLPDGGIKTMDKLEEAFLKRWSIKEDPNMLLTRLNSLWKH